ncbi:MAG: c-type cytochrome [Planctomycetota bacterium]
MRSVPRQLLPALLAAGLPAQAPQWIWSANSRADQVVCARRVVALDRVPDTARLWVTCDNALDLWVNGAAVALRHADWWETDSVDVTALLNAGANVIAVRGQNTGGPGALALRFVTGDAAVGARPTVELGTDARWRVLDVTAGSEPVGWRELSFDAAAWEAATELGGVGQPGVPWTAQVGAEAFGLPAMAVAAQRPEPASELEVLSGFAAEIVYRVSRDQQGSWVALTAAPDGRLYASDQGSRGLFCIAPARLGDPAARTTVERVDVALAGGTQGLAWAHDSLYAVVNAGGGKSGLYRLTDSDGDAQLDQVELLTALRGSGEHGPHAIVPAPDGETLFVMAGNHTHLPAAASSGGRIPLNWGEDLLLPRQWDARGHARGRLAPGGWICEVDPTGTQWDVFAIGFRNAYDMAFNPRGELFTYDSDMEWDMGMPWYRPTRICHVTSGAEFGWRSGTGKWPAFYEDALPAVLDLGPGSPTGVVFGTGARFPERYQRALFVLDWTFGTIRAVHLDPRGASYAATAEEVVAGEPLPVADAVIGGDGALYFVTGGRGLPSALYRLRSVGDVGTARVAADDGASAAAAAGRRRALEHWHGRQDSAAVEAVWPALGDADRFVRYAARVGLEAQPVEDWRERALAENDPRTAASALVALARQGAPEDLRELLAALGRVGPRAQSETTTLALLRAYALAFVRMGRPPPAARAAALEFLERGYPAERSALNVERCRLLVYLQSPTVVTKTLPLLAGTGEPAPAPDWVARLARNATYGDPIRRMLEAAPPVRGLHFAFLLRNVRHGWTLAERRAFFAFLRDAERAKGGNSYGGFLRMLRREALASCSDADRRELADVLDEADAPRGLPPAVMPEGPRRAWTLGEAVAEFDGELRGRDYERGQGLFVATSCATCHRFAGVGGSVGPDLTSVGNTFSVPALLEAIVDPSRVISDQYGSSIVMRRDGSSVFGLVVEGADGGLAVYSNTPGAEPVTIPKADVVEVRESSVSQMPPGLVDALNADELRDLVAFLLSRGDPKDRMFR